MRTERLAKTNISILRWYVVERDVTKSVSIVQAQSAKLSVAEPCCVRQHGLENRLQLSRRTADDLQHLRGRGLLLQRLGQFGRARLHLVEQAHVLDRNHRLVGEGRSQLDLFLGERADGRALQYDHTDGGSLTHERDA